MRAIRKRCSSSPAGPPDLAPSTRLCCATARSIVSFACLTSNAEDLARQTFVGPSSTSIRLGRRGGEDWPAPCSSSATSTNVYRVPASDGPDQAPPARPHRGHRVPRPAARRASQRSPDQRRRPPGQPPARSRGPLTPPLSREPDPQITASTRAGRCLALGRGHGFRGPGCPLHGSRGGKWRACFLCAASARLGCSASLSARSQY